MSPIVLQLIRGYGRAFPTSNLPPKAEHFGDILARVELSPLFVASGEQGRGEALHTHWCEKNDEAVPWVGVYSYHTHTRLTTDDNPTNSYVIVVWIKVSDIRFRRPNICGLVLVETHEKLHKLPVDAIYVQTFSPKWHCTPIVKFPNVLVRGAGSSWFELIRAGSSWFARHDVPPHSVINLTSL